jgi:hypothetical protein
VRGFVNVRSASLRFSFAWLLAIRREFLEFDAKLLFEAVPSRHEDQIAISNPAGGPSMSFRSTTLFHPHFYSHDETLSELRPFFVESFPDCDSSVSGANE